jgi:nitrogen regulatory protein PII
VLVLDDIADAVINEIIKDLGLLRPRQGILFCINTQACIGIAHLKERGGFAVGGDQGTHDVIFTIVNRGESEKVVDASKTSGARGGTIICGRGTGIHENVKLLGIPIEPEKEIVLTIIEKERTEEVLAAINKAAQLELPGKGIAFVVNACQVAGMSTLP